MHSACLAIGIKAKAKISKQREEVGANAGFGLWPDRVATQARYYSFDYVIENIAPNCNWFRHDLE